MTREQEARAREKAHELGGLAFECAADQCCSRCDRLTAHLLAEREKLDGARAALEVFASEGCHVGIPGNTNCLIEAQRPGYRLERACYACRAGQALEALAAAPPTSAATTNHQEKDRR